MHRKLTNIARMTGLYPLAVLRLRRLLLARRKPAGGWRSRESLELVETAFDGNAAG